jgi:REP element-mobilizing transposase RayT
MPFIPGRGHAALRCGRWSSIGAEYFLTVCTADRKLGLAESSLSNELLSRAESFGIEGIWQLRTAVVMPDHLHLLVVLQASDGLGAAMRLYKGRLAADLRGGGLRWEKGYFDHRLRPQEDCLPVFLYIFLNPYRAGLVVPGQKWQGYYCAEEDWEWFQSLTDSGTPFPEWLR